jgi:hypothetical protein
MAPKRFGTIMSQPTPQRHERQFALAPQALATRAPNGPSF